MTTMQDQLEACKRHAYQIAPQYPGLKHAKHLDLAAQALGYPHFTALQTLYRQLGPSGVPSRIELVRAGLPAALSPLAPVDTTYGLAWGNGSPPPPPQPRKPGPAMTESDVRAVLEKEWHLTAYGLGATRQSIEEHGTYRKAVEAGQAELLDRLDECNKALRFLLHVDKRKTINTKLGTSYGLKHSVEHFNKALKDGPANYYVCNGAFICAAIHLGFEHQATQLGGVNAFFNMSSRSPVFEWRQLENERPWGRSRAHARLIELRERLGTK